MFTPCYMLLFFSVGKIFLKFICISFVYIKYICIFVYNIKTKKMKRFSKSKTYLDKDGNKYSYEGKYRGYWQFYKFLGSHTPLNTYSESELLELKLTEK